MPRKIFTREEVKAKFDNLTKNKKIETLYSALDFMQGYNGRSKFDCIAAAMGFYSDDGAIFTKHDD